MTPTQQAAFAEGGGGGLFTAPYLLNAIATIGVTAIILYVAWLVQTSYQEYGQGKIGVLGTFPPNVTLIATAHAS